MIPEIKFEKVERNCIYNRTAKEKGKPIVYDFRVLIDGIYRAFFTEGYVGNRRRWELHDTDGQPIKWNPGSKFTISCRFQNQFLGTITEYKDHIPTPEQIAERTRQREEERQRIAAEAKAEQEAEARRQRLEAAQEELLAAGKYAVEAMQNMRQGRFQGATARLRKIIDQIEGK